MLSPSLATPAYAAPHLQAPHVSHIISLPSLALGSPEHLALGSDMVSPTDPPLHKLSSTPRSTPKLQARITMHTLHGNPVPCVHLTFFHFNYIQPLGPAHTLCALCAPPQTTVSISDSGPTEDVHVPRFHHKNTTNMKDQGSILDFTKEFRV